MVKELFEASIGDVANRLIVLGAGASIESGLPAGPGLHKMLRRNQQLPLYGQISDALLKTHGYPDIERSFRLLEHLAEVDEPGSLGFDLKALGWRGSQRPNSRSFSTNDARIELETIIKELRKALWHPSGWGGPTVAKVLQRPYETPPNLRYLRPLVEGQRGGTIASLNYDNSVEEAAAHVLTRSRGVKRVTIPEEEAGKTRVLKLHGSLDWKYVPPYNHVIAEERPLEGLDYRPAIIFGAGNKLRHYGPFLDLFRTFVERLNRSRFVTTIGYGFKDPHINEALRLWVTEPATDLKRLTICIGPNGTMLPEVVGPWESVENVRIEGVAMTTEQMCSFFAPS